MKKLVCVGLGFVALLLAGCSSMGHVTDKPPVPKRSVSGEFPPGHDLNPITPQSKPNMTTTKASKSPEKVLVIPPGDSQ